MNYTYYEMNDQSVSETANFAMDAAFDALLRDGVLTPEQREACNAYGIVIVKPGWFRDRLNKLIGLTKTTQIYKCVKLIP